MEKVLKAFYKSSIITSLILLTLGILLIFESEATILSISYIIGGCLIAAGLTAIINFFRTKIKDSFTELNIVYGIVTSIAGILIIKNPHVIGSFIPIVIGVGIIINSAMKLQYAFELKNLHNHMWKATMIISIISTLCGIILLFNPFAGAVILTKIIGGFIIAYALLDIFSTYTIKKNVVEIKNAIENDVMEAEVVDEKTTKKKR